jgi:CheY-like chemotaxis protein/HPt (histidine-containing phosphotransfer) domain-containing protein
MSDAQVGRLFQAFSQADTSTTRKFGGTGLGLTICQRLVGLMEGHLEVQSRLGHGTSVHVTLPLKAASAGSGLHRAVELAPRRTLVVDHHETTRRALARLLGAWGFEVRVASSGAEGLAALEAASAAGRPFELLFVDWKLPGLNGLDFLRRVHGRGEPGPRAVAVLLVSAFEGAPLASSAGAAAVDRVLEKPVSRSRLGELLGALQGGALQDGALQGGARPSASAEPVHSAGSLFERARPIHGARVLVVEDNPTNQLVASGLLEKMGLIVEVVSDGRAAVERASAERYDVVLMDLQMPGVDGLEATRRLRATELGQKLPIIAMTAAAMKRDREASQAAGMNGHVDKPIDAEDLLSALLAWVPHRPATARGGASRKARRPSAAAMEPARGVDFDPDGALLRLGGDLELYRRILGAFETEVAQMTDELKDAVGADDWKAARGLAHKLKGAAGNAGAWALARQAADLEWDLKHQRDRGLWALEEKVRRAVQHCRRFLSSSPPSPRPRPSVSREVVGEALDELHRMLRGHRIVPHELLEQVEAGRAWGVGDDAMNALAGAVEAFRYEEALAALETVKEQLEVVHVEPSPTSASADSPGGRLAYEPADLGRDPLA